MSLDQHIYGPSDWHLPSPSSTPKSVTFPETNNKTPQTRRFPPSRLLDTSSTPLVNGQHTPVQTPSLTLSTPEDWPSSSYSQAARTPEDPEFHVNHFAPQNLPLPPVEASRRLSSSPDPNQPGKAGVSPLKFELGRSRTPNMDFSQMQTPPPTRDATSRRSFQHSTSNNFSTPATIIHRTPNQMPTAEALFNQTPFGLPSTHFSPDMMPFANAGPMSAPAMPQSRLFWDPSTDITQMDVDMPLASDPFGATTQNIDQNMNWQTFNPPVTNQMNPLPFQSFPGMSPSNPAACFDSGNMGRHNSRSNSFVSTSTGVDPSMLFSFSGPETTDSFGTMPQPAALNISSRQPYETQARDSLRERELAKKARGHHSRTNTNSSSGSAENTKPGLQRNNIENGSKKSRPSSMESRTSSQAAASTIPRRSSPLKRQSGGPLTSIPEIRRPRTRLIIDENGRARTETIPAVDEQEVHKDPRRTSQIEVRRQYPGLWEEDDTESEEDDIRPAFSRNASFIIPQPQRRSSSKHARTESGSMERSNSFKMPRPNLKSSFGGLDKSSFETIRPIKKSSDRIHRRFSMMDLPTSFDSLKDGEDQQMPDSPGDALGALKKVVAGRQQRIERASQNTLKAHNRRWAQASAEHLNATTPHGHGHYDPFTNTFTASPNTDGLTTPSTDRSSLSSESTRCVCNGADDGQPMIQCESCNKWLHISCVGLNRHQQLPPVFVCIFCTGQTPVARGGRVRGPIPFDSPLTQKSVFRR